MRAEQMLSSITAELRALQRASLGGGGSGGGGGGGDAASREAADEQVQLYMRQLSLTMEGGTTELYQGYIEDGQREVSAMWSRSSIWSGDSRDLIGSRTTRAQIFE